MLVAFHSFEVYPLVSKKVIYPNVPMMIIVVTVFSFVYRFSAMRVNFIMDESKFDVLLFFDRTNENLFSLVFRWFVIKDSYITYLRPDTFEVRFPMLVDRAFEISSGFRRAGTYHGIKITNLQRSLVLKCRTKRDCDEWIQHLTKLKEQANDFHGSRRSRFNSFAPIRTKQLAYW